MKNHGTTYYSSLGDFNHPWEAATIEEEEKKMKPAVEESNFTRPELRVTDEQGKHSTNVNL